MGISKPKGKKKEEKKEAPKPKKKQIEGVRGIVRISEFDVDGNKKIPSSILKIKGVGKTLASVFVKIAGLDPNALMGSLSDDEVKKLEDVIKDPVKFGVPSFLLNRRKDRETGEDKHLVASTLVFSRKTDIDALRKMKCYRGMRHSYGLPVRGQNTRSSFRKGAIVGVSRKAMKEKNAGKKKEAK